MEGSWTWTSPMMFTAHAIKIREDQVVLHHLNAVHTLLQGWPTDQLPRPTRLEINSYDKNTRRGAR